MSDLLAVRKRCGAHLLFLLSSQLTVAEAQRPEVRPLAQRLEDLVRVLDSSRLAQHIPGLAIAVVKDDEVILVRGLGFADVESKTPVTAETPFPIGSATKPFTAAAIATLVDDGVMRWDDPVTHYLPFFRLRPVSGDGDTVVTIRDLLAHRTGFAGMTRLFLPGNVTREGALRAAANAKPMIGFRRRFLYSNAMYVAAGAAAGNAASSSWETLVTQRLLEPLGMTNSHTSVARYMNDPQRAVGYLWDQDRERFTQQPLRRVNALAPAGAIVSTAQDMAQWIRFQLGRGVLNSRRLVSESVFRETWTSQIEIRDGLSYGLGWYLSEWQGQPVIEHGGNVRGFAAQVAALPESNLAFVLLMNVTAAPLQQAATNLVWETLLGEPPVASLTDAGKDYSPLLGTYLPTHRNAEFKVVELNGRLAVEMPPTPQPFELHPPDDNGLWRFIRTDQMAVSFERNDAGAVVAMKIHMGEQVFECVRAGVEVPPAIDLRDLAKYLGSYRSKGSGTTMRAFVQNNRLALEVQDQAIYELYPPTEDGHWVFRIRPTTSVSFQERPSGHVVSLTVYQANAPAAEFVRVDTASGIPTVEEILAVRDPARRAAAMEHLGTWRLTGTVRMLHAGIEGTVASYTAGTDRHFATLDFGQFGADRLWINSDQAWSESLGELHELHGRHLAQAQNGHPAAILGDWRRFISSLRVLRNAERSGKTVHVVQLTRQPESSVIVYVDAASGDVLEAETDLIDPSASVTVRARTVYEDYRDVEGMRIPFRIITFNPVAGRTIIQFDDIDVRIAHDDALFRAR